MQQTRRVVRSTKKRRKRYRWNPAKKRRFFKTVTFLLIIIVAATCAHAVSNARITAQKTDEPDLAAVAMVESKYSYLYDDSKKINILVLGVNTNLTDTIMVANYDIKTKELNIISVPRDTYYVRNENDSDVNKKLNAAYKGKVINTAKAVSDILCDIPIHYYVVIDYDAVEKVVDAMGGVPMDIPFHMYYNDVWDDPPLHIDIKEGYQILNGENAVKFLRFRHGDAGYPSYAMGDLGRAEAQQAFIKSAIKQCIGVDILKIAKTAYSEVDSNMTVGNVVTLAKSAIGMHAENVKTCTIPGTVQECSPWFYYPNHEEIEKLIKDIYSETSEATDSQ